MFRPLAAASALTIPLPLTASPAQAQSIPPEQAGPPAPDRYHDEAPAGIVVTAPFQRNQEDILSGTSVLTGQELTRELRTTIGGSLQREPGVSATSFGPNAAIITGAAGRKRPSRNHRMPSLRLSSTPGVDPFAKDEAASRA